MSKKIIPFGKYKGQPVEVLQGDPEYSDWLTQQQWFRERFVDLFTMIAAVQTPTETPEHNAMQVRFLDDDYLSRLLIPLLNLKRMLTEARQDWAYNHPRDKSCPFPDSVEAFESGLVFEWRPEFERHGADVEVAWHARFGEHWIASGRAMHVYENPRMRRECGGSFRIELKPLLGDDYPAVLRQMNHSFCNVLIVKEYSGVGATWEQVVKMAALSRITAIFD